MELYYLVKYIIGYPGWDKQMDVRVKIEKGALRIYNPVAHADLIIDAKNIIDVSFDAISKRSGARAATGALIGGVLTGGIGLLAGAAIGAKAKDKSQINICFVENGVERQILLLTKEKTNEIYNKIIEANAYAVEHHADEEATKQSFYAVKPELNPDPQVQERLAAEKEKEQTIAAGCVIAIAIAFLIFYVTQCS